MEFIIRDMLPDDWEQVRQIYLEGLATGLSSFETEAPDWEHWDRSHHIKCRLVACRRKQVVAWAALSPASQRKCYAGVAEFSLYVAQFCRGMGVGKRLLEALVDASDDFGIWTIFASTFPENTASLRVQLACGFRIVGRRDRIAQHLGVWRDTVITERRSKRVGV